jgi:hypothetical protein
VETTNGRAVGSARGRARDRRPPPRAPVEQRRRVHGRPELARQLRRRPACRGRSRIRALRRWRRAHSTESLRPGADLVCFGDKLLGGPQAESSSDGRISSSGCAVILQRSVRTSYARGARGTLAAAASPRRSRSRCPDAPRALEAVLARAVRLPHVGGEVEETVARVGGGARFPPRLASAACGQENSPSAPAANPVIALVRDGKRCSTAGP